MKSEILKRISNIKVLDEIVSSSRLEVELRKPIFCSPLYGVSKSAIVLKLIELENQTVLLLPESKDVEELFVELNLLGLSNQLIILEDFTREAVQEKLTKISKQKKFILVSTYELLSLKLPSKEHVEKTTTLIQVGGKIKYDELIEYLNLLNYQRDQFVEAPGEFSVRGSIIDFWSFSEANPARLEFDGDFLESIRYFDPESQRSIEKLETASLAGAFDKDEVNSADIFGYLENPLILASTYEIQNRVIKSNQLFSEENPIENIGDPNNKTASKDEFHEIEKEEESSQNDSFKLDFEELINKNGIRWILEEEIASSSNRIELGFSQAPTINSNYKILFNILKEYSVKNYDVVLTSENELQTSRLTELLSEFNGELAELIESRKIKLETLPIKEGFIHNKEKILLLTDYQIFNKPYRTKLSS
ncbi:MAG: transcription-repair coupling factor, partial [Ignavibacteriaceae bacterium]|nr:transcription-repair coupling factor [Ignavibacteriaceae bacterium]